MSHHYLKFVRCGPPYPGDCQLQSQRNYLDLCHLNWWCKSKQPRPALGYLGMGSGSGSTGAPTSSTDLSALAVSRKSSNRWEGSVFSTDAIAGIQFPVECIFHCQPAIIGLDIQCCGRVKLASTKHTENVENIAEVVNLEYLMGIRNGRLTQLWNCHCSLNFGKGSDISENISQYVFHFHNYLLSRR